MRTVCVQRVIKALFIRTLRWKYAVRSLPACDVFHNPDSTCYFLFFYARTVRRLCVTGTNLGERKHNEFRACALLALVWRCSGVYIHTWKNVHILWTCRKRAQKLTHTFSSNHQQILKNAQRITTHWPIFFIFWCAGRAWWYVYLAL